MKSLLLIFLIAVTVQARALSIYYAAGQPPTENIPAESPLCYKFQVANIEEQLNKLKIKYPNLYDAQTIKNDDGSRSLLAKRKSESGEEFNYFYSESPQVCNAYQQTRLNDQTQNNITLSLDQRKMILEKAGIFLKNFENEKEYLDIAKSLDIRKVDLNSDTVPEYIIVINHHSYSGIIGRSFFVISQKENTYNVLLDNYVDGGKDDILVDQDSSNNWKNIIAARNAGPQYSHRYTYSYDGSKYIESKCTKVDDDTKKIIGDNCAFEEPTSSTATSIPTGSTSAQPKPGIHPCDLETQGMMNVLKNRQDGISMEEYLLLNKPKKPEITPQDRYRISSEENQRSIEKAKRMTEAWKQGSEAARDMEARLAAEDRLYVSPVMTELAMREQKYQMQLKMQEIAAVIYQSKDPQQTIVRIREKCLTDAGLDKATPIHPEIAAQINKDQNPLIGPIPARSP